MNAENMRNDEGLYIITVIAEENQEVTSADIGLERIDSDPYAEDLNNMRSEIAEDSPLNKIIYAGFYEQNGLLIDALTKLQEAINENPDVDDFKMLRKDLIERSGIKVYKEDETEEE